MQYTSSALVLLSAALSLAAPTSTNNTFVANLNSTNSLFTNFNGTGNNLLASLNKTNNFITSTGGNADTDPSSSSAIEVNDSFSLSLNNTLSTTFIFGFALPNVLKVHDVSSNFNQFSVETETARAGVTETSTLYQIPVPFFAAGHFCSLVFKASFGDVIEGTGQMDIFNNNIDDLALLNFGNHRNEELARISFDPFTGFYDFDFEDVNPLIAFFPCPAGKVLEWESVAVGDFDINIVRQDFFFNGFVPNGLSIAIF